MPRKRAPMTYSPERRAAASAKMRELNADPAFHAAKAGRKITDELRKSLSEGGFKGMCRRHYNVSSDIECPPWVPKDLRIEFYQMAGEVGEIEAASRVRQLKKEAEGAEPADPKHLRTVRLAKPSYVQRAWGDDLESIY